MPHVSTARFGAPRRLLTLLLSAVLVLAGLMVAFAPASLAVKPDPVFFPNVTAGDRSLTVNVPNPGTDPPITSYSLSITENDAIQDYSITVLPDADGSLNYTKTDLINGHTYYVRVLATNNDGTSDDAGFTLTPVMPDVIPLAPTDVSAVGLSSEQPSEVGTGSAEVRFTRGADNGGTPPTGYSVSSTNGLVGGFPCSDSPCTVTGLTNGTSYSFTVTATNGAGTSEPSAPGNDVVPRGAPFAPTDVRSAGADPRSATVSFVSPIFSGEPVTGYEVSSDGGTTWRSAPTRVSGSRRLITATGLRSGIRYPLVVRAVNIINGAPRPGAPSSAITVLTGPSIVLGQPASRAGTAAVLVVWAASRERDVVGYTVYSSRGATCSTGARTLTSCIVGARAGVRTTYRVVARSRVGSSYPSAPTRVLVAAAPYVPKRVPGVPGGFSARPKTVKSGKNTTLTAPGFLPGSTVVLVAYGKKRHVLRTLVANSRGAVGAKFRVPKDKAKRLTFVAFGVTPYASSKAISTSVKRR